MSLHLQKRKIICQLYVQFVLIDNDWHNIQCVNDDSSGPTLNNS